MIYDTQTVYAPEISTFDRALNAAIQAYANQGLDTEVQFQYQFASGGRSKVNDQHRYVALVVAKRPSA